MAYMIRSEDNPLFGETIIKISDDDKELISNYFAKNFARPNSLRRVSWNSGSILPDEIIPRELKIDKGKNMYDFMGINGGAILVSSRFKDAVEFIEPNVHQFFPVSLMHKNHSMPLSGFYIFNIVGIIDAIIEEKSNLKATGRGQIDSWIYERKVGPWKCAMNASIIANKACWVERRYGSRWIISNKLAKLLKEINTNGYDLYNFCDEL